jgi:hypothetical protein
VYSVPHLVFRAFHTEPFTGIDNAATLASLAAPVAASLAATVLVWRASRRLSPAAVEAQRVTALRDPGAA